MKIVSIGTDRKIFEKGSSVATRTIAVGKKVDELHVVVFNIKNNTPFLNTQIGDNVWLYPTNSFSRWLYVFDAIRISKKIIRERLFTQKNDVVTCQDPFECGLVGYVVSKKFNLRLCFQIHTDFLSPYFARGFLNRIRVPIARFLLPHAYRVRVVSKRIRDSLSKAKIKLQNPPQVLPIRIDIESMHAGKPEDSLKVYFPDFSHIVFMASRLTKEKRIQDALYAFKKVLEHYPHAGLVIAGLGEEIESLKKVALNLGISHHVMFIGWQKNISSLMSSAHVFLSTSAYEGYGMSIIEAGLSQCPVVSTDVGVSGEILKDSLNSFVCPVGGISCIAKRVSELFSDSALRETLSGRLNSDIRASILTQEEYITAYVGGFV